MRRWSRIIGKPLLALAATLLALGVCEVVVRLVGAAPEVIPIGITNDESMFRRSKNPILSYEHKPNYRNASADPQVNFPSINSHGQRDVEHTYDKPAGVKRVLILGDSVAAGYGVKDLDDLMSRQFEHLFPDGSVEVLNLAVSGYSTRAEVELLKQEGLRYDPDLVILVFVENDFTNFHREASLIEGIYDRPWIASALFRASHLFRLVCLKLNLFGFGLEADPAYWNQQALGDNNVDDGLTLLRQLAEEHGFEVLIVSWPLFTDTDIQHDEAVVMPEQPHELIVDRLARMHGLQSVGLADAFRRDWQSLASPANPRRFYTVGDKIHPSVAGHHVAAAILKELITERRLLEASESPRSLSPPARTRDEAALEAARARGTVKSDYAAVHLNRGKTLVKEGNIEEGIRELEKAMRINPKYAGAAHFEIGKVLRSQAGRLDESAEHLAEAVGLDPADWEFRTEYALTLQKLGKYPEAIDQLAAAVGMEPDSGYLHHLMGAAQRDAGHLPEAAASYTEAVRFTPLSSIYHNNYGNVLRLLKRYPQAIEQFEKALELEPGMREAQFNLALAFESSGQTAAAIVRLEKLLEEHPDDAEGYYALGNILSAQGLGEQAVVYFERAVALRPGFADAWNNLGATLLAVGREEDAAKKLELAARLNPESAAIQLNLAEAYAKTGRTADALTRARQAKQLAEAQGDKKLVQQIDELLSSLKP